VNMNSGMKGVFWYILQNVCLEFLHKKPDNDPNKYRIYEGYSESKYRFAVKKSSKVS
jgi:hypothetical protein